MSNLFDTCLCVNKFRNLFCNPLIKDSNDQSLIGQSGCSMFLVNHSLVLPLSHVPKNCTWVSVYLTPKRPCSLNHCSILVTDISYTSRSELPEYSSGGLIYSLLHAMTESAGSSSELSSNALRTMRIIGLMIPYWVYQSSLCFWQSIPFSIGYNCLYWLGYLLM